MTRTDVMASSRPRSDEAGPLKRGWSRIRPGLTLVSLALVLLASLLLPMSAVATETTSTSGYGQEPPKPKEKEPATGTSPSKESSEPAKETSPATSEAKPTTLPFTGFDLRWSFAVGVLLIGAGVSIVIVQRRQRHREQR